jgi:hypothetical protein
VNDDDVHWLLEEMSRRSGRADIIGITREAGGWVPAHKCPGCGRYARTEAGNDSSSAHYWLITSCALCGRYECRGGPMEWRGTGLGARVTVKKLEEE